MSVSFGRNIEHHTNGDRKVILLSIKEINFSFLIFIRLKFVIYSSIIRLQWCNFNIKKTHLNTTYLISQLSFYCSSIIYPTVELPIKLYQSQKTMLLLWINFQHPIPESLVNRLIVLNNIFQSTNVSLKLLTKQFSLSFPTRPEKMT